MVDDDGEQTELAPTARESASELAAPVPELPPASYELGDVLGKGGMGEVFAATDQRIGREVALKRLRSDGVDGPAVNRFLREARIQARLDHPAIVPVHELGIDPQGRPYFTMKRLRGTTLAHKLTDGTPQNRLLRAFVEVCQAVDFAHARGVVHRDLKPANIMLGDYGEVYVIDWGVARVLAERSRLPTPPTDTDTIDENTQTGALLGTPGFIAPETIQGTPVTPAVDVYALGAILFEILTHEALHPKGVQALTHTLAEPQEMPSRRAKDAAIPPELDAVCHAALAEDPGGRPTAHDLADAVQDYLDGDRDVDRRRRLAAAQLADARAALVANDRATAMRTAGRALALDPESTEAAELVTKLLVEPPATLPSELVDELDRASRAGTRMRVSRAVIAYSAPLLSLLALPWLHVKSWAWLLALYVGLVITGGVALWMGLVRGRTSLSFLLIANLGVVVLWSRLAGPLMLTPVLICGVLLTVSSHPKLVTRSAVPLLVWGVVASFLPLVLEALSIIPRTLTPVDRGLLTQSTIFESTTLAHLALVIGNALFILVLASYASQLSRVVASTQRELRIRAWHLRKLLPHGGAVGITSALPAGGAASRA